MYKYDYEEVHRNHMTQHTCLPGKKRTTFLCQLGNHKDPHHRLLRSSFTHTFNVTHFITLLLLFLFMIGPETWSLLRISSSSAHTFFTIPNRSLSHYHMACLPFPDSCLVSNYITDVTQIHPWNNEVHFSISFLWDVPLGGLLKHPSVGHLCQSSCFFWSWLMLILLKLMRD